MEEMDQLQESLLDEKNVKKILGEFFRIIETYCEKKEASWKNRFVTYWAGERAMKLAPFKILG